MEKTHTKAGLIVRHPNTFLTLHLPVSTPGILGVGILGTLGTQSEGFVMEQASLRLPSSTVVVVAATASAPPPRRLGVTCWAGGPCVKRLG